MKSNGSVYVAAVFAALAGYFVYQWWFNPNRMIKAQLGQIATALSVPADETAAMRTARLLRLRQLAVADLHVNVGANGPSFTSRDALLAALGELDTAAGGRNVDFGDADVVMNAGDSAKAFVTADVTTRNPQTGTQTLDSREVTFSFVNEGGDWLVRDAEVKDLQK